MSYLNESYLNDPSAPNDPNESEDDPSTETRRAR
jgi:hypothetical protein